MTAGTPVANKTNPIRSLASSPSPRKAQDLTCPASSMCETEQRGKRLVWGSNSVHPLLPRSYEIGVSLESEELYGDCGQIDGPMLPGRSSETLVPSNVEISCLKSR